MASDESAPRPPSPKVMAVALVVAFVGLVGFLVSFGVFAWIVGVLERPAGPLLRPLSFGFVATMSIGLGVLKLALASAGRRPRWQRAQGTLLLIGAGWVLVRLVLKS